MTLRCKTIILYLTFFNIIYSNNEFEGLNEIQVKKINNNKSLTIPSKFPSDDINFPNRFDAFFRKQLRWEIQKLNNAAKMSDYFLYGGLFCNLLIRSQIAVNHQRIRDDMATLSITGAVTYFSKLLAGRERPSSYYGTRDEGKDSFKSFFSGHTSISFCIGTRNSLLASHLGIKSGAPNLLLEKIIPSATGYYRIAADKHYMTDVLVGAIVGTLIGKSF